MIKDKLPTTTVDLTTRPIRIFRPDPRNSDFEQRLNELLERVLRRLK